MNLAQRERLSELVEELTTSGESQLNQDKMKEIKTICKMSNDYIEHFYHLIMTQLGLEHAEIRLSAFQLAGELFCRSHHFRTLLVSNFQEFLELTVETDSEHPLPPPKEVARKLKTLAIKTVQAWHASYGEAYKKLALGYHFLKQVKKVDFHDIQARTLAERRREDEREQRMARIYKDKVEKAAKEMEEYCAEIEESVTEMNTCLKLLLPEQFDLCILQTSSNGASIATNNSAVLTSVVNSEKIRASAGDEDQPCCSKDLEVFEDMCEKVEINERAKNTEENEEEREGNKSNKESVPEMRSNNEDEKGMKKEEEGSEGEKEGAKDDSDLEEATDEDTFIRFTGLISHRYNLDLTLSSDVFLKETDDNEAIVTTVRDLYRLMSCKHLPAVQSWVKVLTKAGGQQQLLRQALDLKERVDNALRKHQDLHIDYKTKRRRVIKASADGVEDEDEDEDDEEDDDFEEVLEKEGYEPHVPEHLREEYGLDPYPSTCKDDSRKMVSSKTQAARLPAYPLPVSSHPSGTKRALDEQDPTCAAATLHILKHRLQQASGMSCSSVTARVGPAHQTSGPSGSDEPSCSGDNGSSQEKVCAPVVPFGLDLYYWGQDQPGGGKIIKSASQHQFWVPCEVEEEVENKELSAQMKARYISFPGHFTPVTHTCNAPLPSGALCQRQDRVKCPFHGVIIPRGELGQPTNPEDRARLERGERQCREEQPDWRDPELMRDIEAATGEDLGSNKTFGRRKGKRKCQKKYPKLSDLKQSSNTSRSRLEKKVFNKSSMRRVTEVMNKMDRKKHDKFSNQFNYALN